MTPTSLFRLASQKGLLVHAHTDWKAIEIIEEAMDRDEDQKEIGLCPCVDSPAPWRIEALDGGFKIVDSSGQSLAYVYGHADPRDARIAKALTLDEARRIASNIAKLPALLAKREKNSNRPFGFQFQWSGDTFPFEVSKLPRADRRLRASQFVGWNLIPYNFHANSMK